MIKDNILKIKKDISLSCSKINQEPNNITIVAVSKGRTPEQIREVILAGITDIGENRVQEAIGKCNQLSAIKWHMVGHLQRNKVKEAVRIFDLIQSVDTLRLAYEIEKQASKINKIQDILVEIKTTPEATKFGLKPNETVKVIKEMAELKNINIKGLMTIAPFVDDPEKARQYFRMLRELKEKINTLHITHYTLHILSMGMTDDYRIAIEEGSNMLRLGRAIFA